MRQSLLGHTTNHIKSLARRRTQRHELHTKCLYSTYGRTEWSDMTLGQKVVHTTKNTGYLGVIGAGVGLIGLAVSYYAADALEDWRTERLFDNALAKVKAHERVQGLLGTPIQGFGDPGQRGSGTRLHRTITKDEYGNETSIMMRFYVQGPTKQVGTVFLQQMKNDANEWEYQLLEMEVPKVIGKGNNRVVLIDKRSIPRSSGRSGSWGWFNRSRFH